MNLNKFWSPYCGAVSLTFDDGTENQLEKAVPPLNQFGLKGTFYLQPHGANWRERLALWKEVASAGHEIGNHTLSHICSSNYTEFTIASGLEDKTIAEIEADILAAQQRLLEIAPHQQYWTFAYPCYCTYVGRGASRQSYVPLIARHFIAGRANGEYGFANHPGVIDLACIWGIPTERMSGFEMIGLVEELTYQGLWVIFVFHQIDGARLTVGSYDFRMLLNYLQRRSSAIWTAPVVEVANKIVEFQAR